MSLEKMGQSIESNEVKVRLQATPEDVENVKKSVEYSNHLTKANDVLKVLDFPDNIEESFRKILLKQDNKILEELAKKEKDEILTFISKEKNKVVNNLENQNIKTVNEETQKQNQEINLKNETKNLKDQQTLKNEQDIQKIKSVFTPQILEQNPNLAKEFNNLDKE